MLNGHFFRLAVLGVSCAQGGVFFVLAVAWFTWIKASATAWTFSVVGHFNQSFLSTHFKKVIHLIPTHSKRLSGMNDFE